MQTQLPVICQETAAEQGGIISRRQAIECGVSPGAIAWLVEDGRWRVVHRGVYAVFTGDPSRAAVLWAAVHRAGEGAALSHQTSAELWGLLDQRNRLIHVTVPSERRVGPICGVVLHRSGRITEATHPSQRPPRTRIEETVLDLVDQATTFEAAFGYICASVQRGLTTPDRIASFMGLRKKLRWRRMLIPALADIRHGVHSWLEYRYLHDVERAHGLPTAIRQARVMLGRRSGYLDNLYAEFGVCVELDGRSAHPDDKRWLDIRRDNAAAVTGTITLRYGWDDVISRPCEVAAQIAAVLTARGWTGSLRPCGPACSAARHAS